jgi:hypothetical protein
VSSVTNMASMFQSATAFNTYIGDWDVTSVTSMQSMFRDATKFNQSIGDWNVSKVINTSFMFMGATSFDQGLGNWNVTAVVTMRSMFDNVTLSTTTYDSILNGWCRLPLLSGVTFSGGNSFYSPSASSARQKLIDDFSWAITDGGIDPALLDADGDGISDATDNCINRVNPDQNDTDTDADNDGVSNYDEYVAGTDPQDPSDYPDTGSSARINPSILMFTLH